MSKIGFGFVGGGGISNVHLTALSKRDDAQIVCIADVNPDTAKAQAEKYQAGGWVTDNREMLATPGIDAVVVCTPTFLHAEPAIAAAQAGKHLLCEKPMAMTLADCDRMMAASEAAGKYLMIAFVRRFCNEWLKLREILQAGTLGHPVLWRGVSGSSGPRSPWFLDAEKGGGPFIDGCVHDWDFARFTFGEVAQVNGSIWHMKEGTTSLDTGTALVRFQSGDELMRSWTWGLPGAACRAQGMADVIGPKGTLFFPGAPVDGKGYFTHIDGEGQENKIEFDYTGGQEWFDAQMDHFVTCLKEGRTPSVTGLDGKKAVEIALGVMEAGSKRQPISF